jgi:Rieske 2Fe-2S family protein
MLNLERIGALFDARKPGHSLPQALYNDPEVYAFDLEAIFARSWILVGFDVELPKAGSHLALTLGSWPVLVTRDRSGMLRGFHNSCRHRGAQICQDGTGTSARLVCPYHRWTYELTGELVHAGRMGEDFEAAAHGLKPIHVESVGGVIYVCLADKPPPIDDFREKFEPLLAPHNLKHTKVAYQTTLVEYANWKLVMENGRECYHCAGAHPELSASFPIGAGARFDVGEDERQQNFNDRMAQAGLPIGPVDGEWWEAVRFPLNDGYLSMTMDGQPVVGTLMCEAGGGDIGSLRWAVEPHSFCHATADYLFMFSALPVGPNETHVVAKWLVNKDAVEGVDYEVETLIALWNATNLQDKALAENNQRGVNSRGYTPGPYSKEAEPLVMNFVDWYCRRGAAYIGANLPQASLSAASGSEAYVPRSPAPVREMAEG